MTSDDINDLIAGVQPPPRKKRTSNAGGLGTSQGQIIETIVQGMMPGSGGSFRREEDSGPLDRENTARANRIINK